MRKIIVRIRGGPSPRTTRVSNSEKKKMLQERKTLVDECNALVDKINQVAVSVGWPILVSAGVSTANTAETIRKQRSLLEAELERLKEEAGSRKRIRRMTRPANSYLLQPRRPRNDVHARRARQDAAE